VLEQRDGAFMIRDAGIMMQPFMQGGTCCENSEQQYQGNTAAGQDSAEQRLTVARMMLHEDHDTVRND